MTVQITESSIIKRWRENEGSLQLLVKSAAPIDQLLEVLRRSAHRLNEGLGIRAAVIEPAPTPQGVAIFVDSCDDKQTLLEVVRGLAADLEAADVEAKVGIFRAQYSPLDDPFRQFGGYSAGMTLIGQPYWLDEGTISSGRHMWDVDPDAQQRVVEHAINWCMVDGGEYWIRAGTSSYKVLENQREALLQRALKNERDWTILIAAKDTSIIRRVCFAGNGHVIYEIAGVGERPNWQSCVEELRTALTDLHEVLVWGFIQARLKGTSGIDVTLWEDFHRALWAPYGNRVADYRGTDDPRRAPTRVHDVYGIQLLGPGHGPVPPNEAWTVQPLSQGRRIVSHVDQAAWFTQLPTLDLLLKAREDFGTIVDDAWTPTSGDLSRLSPDSGVCP